MTVTAGRYRLPAEPRAYHEFWRTRAISPWCCLAALLLAGASWFVLSMLFAVVAIVIDQPSSLDPANFTMTPTLFLANNLSLAALIGLAFAFTLWPVGQPARFISSVVGGLRWRWLWTCVVIAVPVWAVQTGVELWLSRDALDLTVKPHTVTMILIVATTQVFQCAGEEYGFRGIATRAVGSLVPIEWLGFLVGGVFSSVAFMLVHGAGDPWLNLFYFVFGMCAAFLTWRTGGLEAAIAVHCVNNLFSMSLLPFGDIGTAFVRDAGVGSPWLLVNMGVLVVVTGLLTWLGHRKGLIRSSAPASAMTSQMPWPLAPLSQTDKPAGQSPPPGQ